MDMIGHDHKGVRFDARIMARQLVPCRLHHPPGVIQQHFAAYDIPEETRMILRADGDEIRPGLGVIIIHQPDGSPMMFLRVIFHRLYP
jgi:hypothetical protein